MHSKSSSGFTLIELLVVIAIIGILSSVVLVSMNGARRKARDARRVADLKQINIALQMFLDDHGYYPQVAGCGWDANCWASSNGNGYNSSPTSWSDLAADLAPYLSRLPVDPVNSSSCYTWVTGCHAYIYGNVGRASHAAQYDLATQLEAADHPLRCQLHDYFFYFADDLRHWCTAFGGDWSNQLYEASPE